MRRPKGQVFSYFARSIVADHLCFSCISAIGQKESMLQLKRPLPVRAAARSMIERLEIRRLLATFTVTSLADSGANTLRQAILDANANVNTTDLIAFAINVLHPFTRTIVPTSPLPTITGPVTIDGTTQAGYAGAPIVQ